MKSEKLYDAITEIKDDFIEQAGAYKFRKQYRKSIVRWGTLAACFAVFVLGVVSLGSFQGRGGKNESSQSPMFDTNENKTATTDGAFMEDSVLQVLAYNGSLYNLSNSIEVLNQAGIEEIMTEESCGELIGNLRRTEFGYETTTMETGIAMYKYANAISNEAVMVIRDGEEYMAGLFSNYRGWNNTAYVELNQLYKTYGITEPEHIAMVAERNGVTADYSNILGLEVTDAGVLEAFYEASLDSENEWGTAFSENDFFEFFLKKQMTEEELEAPEKFLAEDEHIICIETAEGLRFYLSYYPNYGWLYSENALAYYPVDESLRIWFEDYLQIH